MGLYCFVVPNLCHETYRRNHDMLCAICAKNEERQITSAVSTLNKPIVNDDDDDDDNNDNFTKKNSSVLIFSLNQTNLLSHDACFTLQSQVSLLLFP